MSLSECCPSRATFLTGQYAHNHGVLSNGPPFGGFARLRGAETLPVWLQRAGYATGLVGKYLNGYGSGDRYLVPPGWTDFEGLIGRSTYRFYDFTMNVNGALETTQDRLPDRCDHRSAPWTSSSRIAGRSFFLWTTYVAPHAGGPIELDDPVGYKSTVPAPRHYARVRRRAAPAAAVVQRARRLRQAAVDPQAAAAGAVADRRDHRDRAASASRRCSPSTRAWPASSRRFEAPASSRTRVVIFTSDNGFMAGEHRVPSGKMLAYEPSIRVPLLMRGPGIPAGVAPPRPGLERRPRADDPRARRRRSRRSRSTAVRCSRRPHRAGRSCSRARPAPRTLGLPSFTGLRTRRYKYVEHLWGAKELYDLRRDPYELHEPRAATAHGRREGAARAPARPAARAAPARAACGSQTSRT